MRLLVTTMVGMGIVVLLTVLLVGPDTGRSTVQSADPPVGDGFRMAEPAEDVVVGSLERPGLPPLKFRSELTVARDERSEVVDKFAVTHVEAGGVVLDAKRNLRTRVITEGGHGKSMTAGAQEALLVLCRALEGSLGNLGTPTMPPEEDQLVRIVCYYAEAPVSHDLTDQTRKPEAESVEGGAPASLVDVKLVNVAYRHDSANGKLGTSALEKCDRVKKLRADNRLEGEDFTTFVACQVSDNDGISYLSCANRTHNLYHDSNVDCFHYRTRYTGPCTGNCLGRCGPGCGVGAPNGVYTRDCGEHDDCGGDHPNCDGIYGADKCCGDEFDDARGDTIDGRFNCEGCNNPYGWFASNTQPVPDQPEVRPASVSSPATASERRHERTL